jgi:hypothetical protein
MKMYQLLSYDMWKLLDGIKLNKILLGSKKKMSKKKNLKLKL